MKKEVTILCLVASGESKDFNGDLKMIQCECDNRKYDIICVKDVSWESVDYLKDKLDGYSVYIDPAWARVPSGNQKNYTALTVDLVAQNMIEELGFNQIQGKGKLALRCAEASFRFSEMLFFLKATNFAHVNSKSKGNMKLCDQENRKSEMLEEEINFQNQYQEENALSVSTKIIDREDKFGEGKVKSFPFASIIDPRCDVWVHKSKGLTNNPSVRVSVTVLAKNKLCITIARAGEDDGNEKI